MKSYPHPKLIRNPYEYDGWWYWTDEASGHHGPYATETEALLYLLRHIAPARWHKRLWRTLKRLWHDSRGQG